MAPLLPLVFPLQKQALEIRRSVYRYAMEAEGFFDCDFIISPSNGFTGKGSDLLDKLPKVYRARTQLFKETVSVLLSNACIAITDR